MKHKALVRAWEIHAFMIVFGLPFLIGYLAMRAGLDWTIYIFGPQALLILLFFFRTGWMAFLRSRFPNLSLYAIRFALTGYFLFSVGIIEEWMTGNTDTSTAFGRIVGLSAGFAIAIALIGTCCQAFVESIRVIINSKEK